MSMQIGDLPLENLQRMADDPTKFHVISQMHRPGVRLFACKLEYTYYPPRSGKNYKFEMSLLKWPEDFPMLWAIMTVPIEDRPYVEEIAAQCGLKLANGIPLVLGGGKEQWFPMKSDRVWSLENTPDHPVYSNNPAVLKELEEKEDAECMAIFNSDRQKLREELHEKGFLDDQIDRILEHWDNGDEDYEEKPLGDWVDKWGAK